jgi:hypothetical protein
MQAMIEESEKNAKELIEAKKTSEKQILQQTEFPLSWVVDSSRFDTINFLGYETGSKVSEVTGMQRLYYDHSKPFSRPVKFYNYYNGINIITAPEAYIIPQGWYAVIDILKLNGVKMQHLLKDTNIYVEQYRIEGYSDYRWEDVAAEYIKQHPEVKQQLEEKKKSDPAFAASSSAQLNFVYKHSPYYEPAHLRYPVYRLMER